MSSIDGLRLRRVMGRELWRPPIPFGPDGWKMSHQDDCGDPARTPWASVIVTCSDMPGYDYDIVHASIAYADGVTMPTYYELDRLHKAVWDEGGYAYQVFIQGTDHVNLHPTALHLWGRLDGKPMLPELAMDFGAGPQI